MLPFSTNELAIKIPPLQRIPQKNQKTRKKQQNATFCLNRHLSLQRLYFSCFSDSSAGASALASGARGRRFKSALSD